MVWRAAIFSLMMIMGVLLWIANGKADHPPSPVASQAMYHIRSSVIGAAGGLSEGDNFRHRATLAQPSASEPATAPGLSGGAGLWNIWEETATGINCDSPAFADQLFQNHPNPFNPTTAIEYTVTGTGFVTITIYNVKGQLVRQLVNEQRLPGRHRVVWDGTNSQGQPVASGIYLYRMRIGGFSDVKKMVVLK
jgi:hypothetical protein